MQLKSYSRCGNGEVERVRSRPVWVTHTLRAGPAPALKDGLKYMLRLMHGELLWSLARQRVRDGTVGE